MWGGLLWGGMESTPTLGASYFEAPDDLPEALVHPLHHLYHSVEMIGHAYCGMGSYLSPFGGFEALYLLPLFHYGLPCFGEAGAGGGRVIVQMAEEGGMVAAVPYHKSDEVDAWGIVVMSRIVGAIGGKDG